jgi:hypothetical protein
VFFSPQKLDLHSTIPPLLRLKFNKHPSLRPLIPLPDDLFPNASTKPMDATTPQGKAQNRILSAKGTGEAVNGVVAWCIGVEGGKLKTGKSKGKAEVARGKQETAGTGSSRIEKVPRESVKPQPKTAVRDAEDEEDLALQDAAADAAGWESGSVGDDAASDDESDSEDGLLASDEDEDRPPLKRPRTLDSSFSPPPLKASSKKADGSGSMFLPTLASGFTMGSYDSDPDEDEKRDKKSGKGGLIQSVRKNRRGQAERRK